MVSLKGRGTSSRRCETYLHLLKELINKSVELAKSGDTTALRLRLKRIMEPVCAKDEALIIEQADSTLMERGQAIVNPVSRVRFAPQRQPHCCKHWPYRHA
jgi:hypothetical protein